MPEPRFIPYPAIEHHGVIGDRRTAAFVAADGTINWFCLPIYDGPSVFGALLDTARGGFWRIGPDTLLLGQQRYEDASAALFTTWETASGTLELLDVMAWPAQERPAELEAEHAIIRRVRCLKGSVACSLHLVPRYDFDASAVVVATALGTTLTVGPETLSLWTSFPTQSDATSTWSDVQLQAGETAWAVLATGATPAAWNAMRAEQALQATLEYWHGWQRTLTYTGPRAHQVRRSAATVHLLSYAPTGAVIAAPTTSLPERIADERNYDYRYAWVRDASLSLAILSVLGDTPAGERYLDTIATLGSITDAPLQVAYRVTGDLHLEQRQRSDLAGYRGSLPVRFGNRAYNQYQLDGFGFLAECVLVYLEHGGPWKDEYWQLMRRVADYTAANWQRPDCGIWELPEEQHYVSSKVMSWITLKRSVDIAKFVGRSDETDHWNEAMAAIYADVMEHGWSDTLGAFRQHYGADTLDAAALLIAVMEFLPADHPRVVATVEQIERRLMIDGFVYRFVPNELTEPLGQPLGEAEGAFLPCTFWLAATYAKQGRTDDAEAVLRRAEAVAGPLGLFAEEVDPRTKTMLGNTPLIWAQMEYVQAIIELARSRPLDAARYLAGAATIQAKRLAQGLKRDS